MNRKLKISMAIPLAMCCAAPIAAPADNNLQVGGSLGIQTKELEYTLLGDLIKIKPVFQTLTVAVNVSYGKFFASIDTDAMLDGDTSYHGDTVARTTTTFESSRKDSALTVGYNVWKGLNVFGGYKTGETSTNISPADGGVMEMSIAEKGPFLGLAYGHPIGGKGTLAASVAYAQFNGEATVLFHGLGTQFTSGGVISGLSYGVSWTGALSDRAYYRLSYRANRYRFKDEDLGFEGKDLSTDENYLIYGITLGTSF